MSRRTPRLNRLGESRLSQMRKQAETSVAPAPGSENFGEPDTKPADVAVVEAEQTKTAAGKKTAQAKLSPIEQAHLRYNKAQEDVREQERKLSDLTNSLPGLAIERADILSERKMLQDVLEDNGRKFRIHLEAIADLLAEEQAELLASLSAHQKDIQSFETMLHQLHVRSKRMKEMLGKLALKEETKRKNLFDLMAKAANEEAAERRAAAVAARVAEKSERQLAAEKNAKARRESAEDAARRRKAEEKAAQYKKETEERAAMRMKAAKQVRAELSGSNDPHIIGPLSRVPVIPVSESITPDGIICLFDGISRKMLHRHLLSKYGISPEEYRLFFNLPDDYPMTAPGYSEKKSGEAKLTGLGTGKPRSITDGPGGNAKRGGPKKKIAPA